MKEKKKPTPHQRPGWPQWPRFPIPGQLSRADLVVARIAIFYIVGMWVYAIGSFVLGYLGYLPA
jgi:hypothetical protein